MMEMTCSGTSEIVKVECPDYVNRICHQAGCPRFLSRVSKDHIDEVGQQLYRGACILNGETEWFSGCLPYKGDEPVLQTGANTVESMVTVNNETRNSGAGRKHRWKGKSEFAGTTTEGFTIDKDSTVLKYKGQTFILGRGGEWDLVDRAIKSAQNRDTGYTIPLPSGVLNAFRAEGKRFVRLFIDREPRKGKGNQKYTGLARLK